MTTWSWLSFPENFGRTALHNFMPRSCRLFSLDRCVSGRMVPMEECTLSEKALSQVSEIFVSWFANYPIISMAEFSGRTMHLPISQSKHWPIWFIYSFFFFNWDSLKSGYLFASLPELAADQSLLPPDLCCFHLILLRIIQHLISESFEPQLMIQWNEMKKNTCQNRKQKVCFFKADWLGLRVWNSSANILKAASYMAWNGVLQWWSWHLIPCSCLLSGFRWWLLTFFLQTKQCTCFKRQLEKVSAIFVSYVSSIVIINVAEFSGEFWMQCIAHAIACHVAAGFLVGTDVFLDEWSQLKNVVFLKKPWQKFEQFLFHIF